MAQFIDTGLVNLERKLDRMANPDFAPLMEQWEKVIVEDNRQGVLSGLDKDGRPLAPVTYRGGIAKPTRRRRNARFGTTAGTFKPGSGGNLSPSEYRTLTGPPLAPRREESRVITNLVTRSGRTGTTWHAEAAWADVVSEDGIPFLDAHFEGRKQKRRDLRGVRPWGIAEARRLLRAYVRRLWRSL